MTGDDAADAGLFAGFADWPVSEPRTDVGAVDLEALMRVLARVEADGHRRGWDGTPMTLFCVYAHDDEYTHGVLRKLCGANPRMLAGARVGPYTAQPVFPGHLLGSAGGQQPYEALRTFAINIAYCAPHVPAFAGVNVIRHVLRLPGVVAVGVTYEALRRPLTTREQVDDELAGTAPDYRTVPDAVELRVVMACDLAGRIHQVTRTRGDRPVTVGGYRMLVPGESRVEESPDVESFGDQSNSLRILADMIVGRNPDTTEGFAARYPSYTAGMRSAMTGGAAG
jgi:hypothetical protein